MKPKPKAKPKSNDKCSRSKGGDCNVAKTTRPKPKSKQKSVECQRKSLETENKSKETIMATKKYQKENKAKCEFERDGNGKWKMAIAVSAQN